jgi:hypothetical protein
MPRMSPWAAFAFALLAGQEKAAASPTDAWKADFKLTLEEKDGHHVFVVAGTTNVPKEVVLKARVFAVEIVDDFQRGKREDEEPLVWEDDEGQPGFQTVEVADGKFRTEVYRFARKPYSILYRGRLLYRPRDQDEAVLKKFGDDDWTRHADFRLGTEKALAEEMRVRVKEVTEDLIKLEGFYNELRKNFAAQKAGFVPAVWKAWKDDWFERVKAVDERNKDRFNLWAVWMERQAKMRVGGMCELLRRMLVNCGDFLAEGKGSEERIREMFDGFHGYFEEAIEVIGLPMPLDAEKVGPILEDYEKALVPLRAWLEKREGPDPRPRARREALGTLFRLPPLLKNRKSAYKLVNDIGGRFRRLIDLTEEAETSPEAVRKALAEHDEALRDFKKLAGVK